MTRGEAGRHVRDAFSWLLNHTAALVLLGGMGVLLARPHADAWAQEQARVAVASQMAQQASLLGALACLQAGGVLLPGACAFPLPGGGARTVPLDDLNGLLAAMVVRPSDGR